MSPTIRNEKDYKEALDRLEELMDMNPDPESMDGYVAIGIELDELIDAVREYEDEEDPYPWTMGVDEWDHLD